MFFLLFRVGGSLVIPPKSPKRVPFFIPRLLPGLGFQRATEWTARVRSSHGIDILVLDGFSHKGVEDFIARSLDETSSCAGGDMDADSTRAVSEDLAMDNSFNGYAFGLSLPRVLAAEWYPLPFYFFGYGFLGPLII